MDRARAQEISATLLRAARGAEAEVTLGGGSQVVAAFAANQPCAHEAAAWPHVSLRVGLRKGRGWQTARAATRDISADALKDLARRALDLARLGAPDPDYLPMLHPEEAGTWSGDVEAAWSPEVAAITPAARAALLAELLLPCRRAGFEASGALVLTDGSLSLDGDPGILAIYNGRGLGRFHASAHLEIQCRVRHRGGGEAWGARWGRSARALELPALADHLIQRAAVASQRGPAPTGPLPVVLEPAAVASLVGALLPSLTRERFDAGQSALGERLGALALDPRLSLLDDPFHPLHLARPFDAEGLATQSVELIRAGLVRGFLYTRATALRHKLPPTGHTPQLPSRAAARARAPVMLGGVARVESLIQEVGRRGLLVPTLRDVQLLEVRAGRFVASARGALWIEGGRLTAAAPPLRLEASALDLLQSVEAGAPVYAGGMVVPPLLLPALHLQEAP